LIVKSYRVCGREIPIKLNNSLNGGDRKYKRLQGRLKLSYLLKFFDQSESSRQGKTTEIKKPLKSESFRKIHAPIESYIQTKIKQQFLFSVISSNFVVACFQELIDRDL